MVGERAAGAVGDGEGEGLEPGGAALGVRGEDDVVTPGLEIVPDQHELACHV